MYFLNELSKFRHCLAVPTFTVVLIFSYAGDLYNEAAEGAMAAMKGRLANKYYALAEEAYAQVEEE